MKLYDVVKVMEDRNTYNEYGVKKGMIGRIWSGEIRNGCFLVMFIDPNYNNPDFVWDDKSIYTLKEDIFVPIKISDLEIVKDEKATNHMIMEDLPKQDPHWWCKVEDGYIMNLLGEKKNKIPFDYDS